MMMSVKCFICCKIVFDHLRLRLFMVFICKIGVNTNMPVELCTLMHMLSGNNQGVRLLEHVR